MGCNSLNQYMQDLLSRSQGLTADLIIVDDNAKTPADQVTPASPYVECFEISVGDSSEEFDDIHAAASVSPSIPSSSLSRWDSVTSPAASTRNAISGLALPRRMSDNNQCKHSQRVRRARRGAIIIPIAIRGLPYGSDPFILHTTMEDSQEMILSAIQEMREQHDLDGSLHHLMQ